MTDRQWYQQAHLLSQDFAVAALQNNLRSHLQNAALTQIELALP